MDDDAAPEEGRVSTIFMNLLLVLEEVESSCTEIGKKAWLFAKLHPGRARKRINATQEAPFSRALYNP